MTYRGEIVFTDDDKDIKSISDDGYIEFSERTGRKYHRLIIEPDKDGTLDYDFRQRGYDDDEDDTEGRLWLAEHLIDFIHVTGLGADSRVERIRKQEGVEGVLKEIRRIESDWGMAIYYESLLESGPLEDEELSDMLRQAGRDLDSDYEKAELLITVADHGYATKAENSSRFHMGKADIAQRF